MTDDDLGDLYDSLIADYDPEEWDKAGDEARRLGLLTETEITPLGYRVAAVIVNELRSQVTDSVEEAVERRDRRVLSTFADDMGRVCGFLWAAQRIDALAESAFPVDGQHK